MNLAIFLLALLSGTLHAVGHFCSKKKADNMAIMLVVV